MDILVKTACTRGYEPKTRVYEEKEIKEGKTDKLRQTLLLSDTTRNTCPQTRLRNREIREIQEH